VIILHYSVWFGLKEIQVKKIYLKQGLTFFSTKVDLFNTLGVTQSNLADKLLFSTSKVVNFFKISKNLYNFFRKSIAVLFEVENISFYGLERMIIRGKNRGCYLTSYSFLTCLNNGLARNSYRFASSC